MNIEAEAIKIKTALAKQLENEMKTQGISKNALAEAMGTSRTQIERLLNPENTSVTLHTLLKAAEVLGKKIKLEMV